MGRIAERPVNGRPGHGRSAPARLDEAEQVAEVRRQEAAVHRAVTLDDPPAGARRGNGGCPGGAAGRHPQWTQRDFQRAEGLFRQALIAAQGPRARPTRSPPRGESARQKLLLLEAGSRPDQVEAARGQLAQARNALDMAKTRLKEMTIFSPLEGVVLRKNLEVGELASPGVPILTLMKPSDIWVRAYVPEEEVGRVKVGSKALVAVDAYPARRFPGRIIEIASRPSSRGTSRPGRSV